MEALRNFSGPLESIHAIYLIAENLVLTKVVPLARLLVAHVHVHDGRACVERLARSTATVCSLPSTHTQGED